MVDKRQVYVQIILFMSEVAASAILLFFGCMGCVESLVYPRLGLLEIAMNFGFVVALCLMTFTCTSGSQLTPTVTLSAWMIGRIKWYTALLYMTGQVLGAILGYTVLYFNMPKGLRTDLCLSGINPQTSIVQAIFIEFSCTSVLSLFCYAVWAKAGADQHDSVSIRFGMCVTAMVFSMAYFTGASMNVPRTLGPALINNNYKDIWVYFVGDLPAPILMGFLWKYVLSPNIEDTAAEE